MKAIIELAPPGAIFAAAAVQLAEAREGRTPDYRLSFESAAALFAALTPERVGLLDVLRRGGAQSVEALATAAERESVGVREDVGQLEELGLVERDNDDRLWVPYEAIEIRLPLAQSRH